MSVEGLCCFFNLPAVIMLTYRLALFFLKQTTFLTFPWPVVQLLSQKHLERDCFRLILLLKQNIIIKVLSKICILPKHLKFTKYLSYIKNNLPSLFPVLLFTLRHIVRDLMHCTQVSEEMRKTKNKFQFLRKVFILKDISSTFLYVFLSY